MKHHNVVLAALVGVVLGAFLAGTTGMAQPRVHQQALPPQYFQDVPPSSPYYPFIQKLAQLGITTGCSANPPLYCPDQPLTRAEAAVFIIQGYNVLIQQIAPMGTN